MAKHLMSTSERGSGHRFDSVKAKNSNLHLGDSHNTFYHTSNFALKNDVKAPLMLGSDGFLALTWLHTSNYEEAMEEVSSPFASTCDWILNHEEYRYWRKQHASGILWYTAPPGSGKSTMAKYLVKYLAKEALIDSCSTVTYFSFVSSPSGDKKILSAFAAILHQLCIKHPELRDYVVNQLYNRGRGILKDCAALDKLLTGSIYHLEGRDLVCVFDSLDKCEDYEVGRLMRFLEELTTSKPTTDLKVKVIILCCPYPDLLRHYRCFTDKVTSYHICIDNAESREHNAVGDDIKIYLQHRFAQIAKIHTLDDALFADLVRKLNSVEGQTFLWAYLVTENMLKLHPCTRQELITAVDSLPPTVKSAYEQILQRCHNYEQARTVFSIVLAAERRLTLQEMDVFLALDSVCYGRRFEVLGDQKILDKLMSVCGLVLEARRTGISFVYAGLKEFLLCTQPDTQLNLASDCDKCPHVWEGSFSLASAHYFLGILCVRQILAKDHGSLNGNELFANSNHTTQHGLGHQSFGDYANQNWCLHIVTALQQSSLESCSTVLANLVDMGLDLERADAGGKSLLHHAIDQNKHNINHDLVLAIIESDGLVTYADHENLTCLHYAIIWDDEVAAQTLLDNGFSIDMATIRKRWHGNDQALVSQSPQNYHDESSKKGLGALHAAVYFGNHRMVSFLLNLGADVNLCTDYGQTPLHLAMSRSISGPRYSDGWEMENYMPEYFYSEYFDNCPEEAERCLERIDEHRLEIVSILCKHPLTNVNTLDSRGRTPLHSSRFKEHASVVDAVEILLDSGANIGCQDSKGLTALHLAARAGDTNSVKAMVQKPHDLMVSDCHGRNALHHAASSGVRELILFILNFARCLNIELSVDLDIRNACHYCFSNDSKRSVTVPRYDAVKALIDGGVLCGNKDKFGQDALAFYVTRNVSGAKEEILDLLAEHCDVHYSDSNGICLIHHLAYSLLGLEIGAVSTLLRHGAPALGVDHKGRNLVHHAAIAGSVSISLLRYFKDTVGLDLWICDNFGRTALSCAERMAMKQRQTQRAQQLFRADRWEEAVTALTYLEKKSYVDDGRRKSSDTVTDGNHFRLWLLCRTILFWFWSFISVSSKARA